MTAQLHRDLSDVYEKHGQLGLARDHRSIARLLDASRLLDEAASEGIWPSLSPP